MAQVPFNAEWAPDSSSLNAAVLSEAKNALCTAVGYGPMPSLQELGADPLPAPCKGLFYARDSVSGGWVVFAGTQTKLYRLISGAWEDVSRTSGGNYGVPDGEYWSATQFGLQVIMVNAADVPQVYTLNSSSDFTALGGSPPSARYVTTIGDFVVLGALSSNLRKFRNSGINNSAIWTVGTDLCDEQELPDGGPITGFHGGEFGSILQDENIFRRMIFQPGQDIAFRVEKIEGVAGSVAPYASVMRQGSVFYYAEHGFQAYTGQASVPIGDKRVDAWFKANSDRARITQMIAFADPSGPRVMWAFHSSATAEVFDRLLILDYVANRFTWAEVESQFWSMLATPGYVLEDLDVYGSLEGVPFSLDAAAWVGGRPTLGAVGAAGTLAVLDGPPLTATFRDSPKEFVPGGRGYIDILEPKGTLRGSDLRLRVNRREFEAAPDNWTDWAIRSALTGRHFTAASARVHQIEVEISHTSGDAWQHLQAMEVPAKQDGLL